MRNIQTLHAHTINSDGSLTHQEVLDICEKNEISVVAFTDHDGVLKESDLKVLREYKGPTRWISGIEISSGLPKEFGGGACAYLHIVGLFVDPTNEALKKHCKLAQEARVLRMEKMVKNLQGIGFNVTEADCLKASGGEAVGRPHIVNAVLSKAENLKVIEEMKIRMAEDAKKDEKVKEQYEMLLTSSEQQHPYILFMTEESYIPGVYVDYQYSIDMDRSVNLIRDAGGLAIIAHYHTAEHKLTPDFMDQVFAADRLDGAETIYGIYAYQDGGSEYMDKSRAAIKELVIKHDKLESGGADAHTEKDFVEFVENKEYAALTDGLVEKMLAKKSVNRLWCSL